MKRREFLKRIGCAAIIPIVPAIPGRAVAKMIAVTSESDARKIADTRMRLAAAPRDDTAMLQGLIDAAARRGELVCKLPPGQYIITGPLTIPETLLVPGSPEWGPTPFYLLDVGPGGEEVTR